MARFLRRLLIILAIALGALGVLGLVAFTWIAYWPLEGGFGDPVRLVSGNVDFVVRASWKDLKETGWLQANLLDDPVVPPSALMGLVDPESGEIVSADAFRDAVDQQMAALRELEATINEQIPGDFVTFSVEDDLLPGDLVAAGRFCEGLGRQMDVPRWYEFAMFTRVSWKPKLAVAALQRGFIREQTGPNLQIEEIQEGVYKLVFPNIRVTSERARKCGPDQIRPPENTYYLTRVRDILVFSNAAGLARTAAELGEFPDSGRSYADRPHVELDPEPGGIVASADLLPLQNYLQRTLESAGSPVTVLQRYLTIPSLHRLNGHLALPSHDQVRAHASIRYKHGDLGSGVDDVYALSPEPPQEGVAALVPQQDTFAALLLRTPPRQLLRAIYEDVLSAGDRRLWRENLRKMGGYDDIEEFFAEFADKLGDTAGIAVGRVSDVYDGRDYAGFHQDPKTHWDPTFPALAMIVPLDRDTTPDELDDYLAKRVPLLGGDPELERATYRGLEYTRVNLQVELGDFRDVSPAWILSQDHFIFASNESYFRKILDTLTDPDEHPPLSRDETFRAAMRELPDRVHVALFVDLEKLFRVPPTSDAGDQPRGFLWDSRNLWIQDNRRPRDAAIAYRNRRSQEIRTEQGGRSLTGTQLQALEEEVDRVVLRHKGRYDEFLEERRRELLGFGRLRALGLGIAADREFLTTDLAVLFRRSGVEADAEADAEAEE